MNGTPHTHQVQIYEYSSGTFAITYGDTNEYVRYFKFYHLKDRIRRKIKRAVYRHDEGSRLEAKKEDIRTELENELVPTLMREANSGEMVNVWLHGKRYKERSEWGSDLLKEVKE